MITDWETTQRLQRPAARGVAVHQGQGLLRDDHPEGVRRPRLLRVRALAGRHQAVDALGHGRGDGDGAELARPGRAAAALRHATSRSSYYLPRLAKGLEIPVLRADQSVRGLRCGVDPRLRHRVLGRARGQARARPVASPGTSATSRSGRSRRCSASPSASTIPTSCSATREDLGITCALIPTRIPGVDHRPPPHAAELPCSRTVRTAGRDVFIPMDWVIGGQPMIGKGWRMLMECLAAGRGISLPSSNTGMAMLAVRAVGGYARVRTQFKTPIGTLRGRRGGARAHGRQPVHDGRDAACSRRAPIDLGEKPAVLSGDRQVPPHRARAADHQRRRWTSSAARASAWARRTSSARAYMQHAGRDHRRGREHPHAQPDHLRPGRDPLPSVSC